MTLLSWVARIVPAAILLQTLFFEFTAAPESVEVCSRWLPVGSGRDRG